MTFSSELQFEETLIKYLFNKGWENKVLKYKTEEELIQNWADILFENNRDIDRLDSYPLTKTEMNQIIDQINHLKTPLKLNGFINGKTISIKRDNIDDKAHFGKEVSLKIYDRQEIAAGQSRYQIAEQPEFKRKHPLGHDRRGDFMLLINGMPLIHIELKKNKNDLPKACGQIEKYSKEGIFTGFFGLVQVFVAMTPEETVYFANPGPEGKFNPDFYFHWADFNNEPMNDWDKIASNLLCIPMAHQLIGFYTVADDSDGVLKVMRSYQYYAANAISDKVSKTKWADKSIYGGYIWHTTGSGKTMTSFKSAQLIANSKDADKVVFLMDRIELGTQSLLDYRAFADDSDSVQETENTHILLSKLKSSDVNETLIVTSIQKMSRIVEDEGFNKKDIDLINSKRIVFIIDECHRSTFGEMLETIKQTFPGALFFGFTGTPIHDENQKKMNTTSDIFGNELHRYTIADGIRDHNVLGFDPVRVSTYGESDLRKVVGLEKAKAKTVSEALSDENKKEIFLRYQNSNIVPMAGYISKTGKYVRGIEDELTSAQYELTKHQEAVVENILKNWLTISVGKKFHAILATSSIKEACEYYELINLLIKKDEYEEVKDLKVTCLFDPSIDNDPSTAKPWGPYEKEQAMLKILENYNSFYGQSFDLANWDLYKKDVALRLAHKKPYLNIENKDNEKLDLLIVVDQMLTGFDSKWINTLYMDKKMEQENIIQAISRTNRLYGIDKPHGTVKYYRFPFTMESNIEIALNNYSGNKPFGIKVPKLKENLIKINVYFDEIKALFLSAGISDFSKLPSDDADIGKFALLFREMSKYLEAAKIQGFAWKLLNSGIDLSTGILMHFDEHTYNVLLQRYKEILNSGTSSVSSYFDIDTTLSEMKTGEINSAYLESKFTKYLKALQINGADSNLVISALDELHKAFASLTQEEQKYANIIIHDIQSGDLIIDSSKSFRDYINDYQSKAKDDQIHKCSIKLGINELDLRKIMESSPNESNLNEFGRFDALIQSCDKAIAKTYFEEKEKSTIPLRKVLIKLSNLIRDFILSGGFDL